MDIRAWNRGPQSAPPTVRRPAPTKGSAKATAMYIAIGASIGVLLLATLHVAFTPKTAAAETIPAYAVTDNVVRLHARDIGAECWDGENSGTTAHLNVAMEVGIDGKIRYATASGGTPGLRSCVEEHVKSWEFLTQDHAQTLALPFEVDRR